jgi:hypothetical protein
MCRQIAILLMTIVLNTAVHAKTAGEMLSLCRDVASASVSGETVRMPTTFDAGECWGAFGTIQEVMRIVTNNEQRMFRVCPPVNSRRTQQIAVFVQYAERNPQRWHEGYFFVAIESLRLAFPCRE